MVQTTYNAKPADLQAGEQNKWQRKWLVIDATDLVLGRLATIVAKILRGKHKVIFTPNMDCGDNVIIINADKIHLTGKKLADKPYYWHTGYPGGIKSRTAGQIMEGKFPERILQSAIERMITRSPLGRDQLRKLHIYKGSEHPHQAQKPESFDIAALNPKNSKR